MQYLPYTKNTIVKIKQIDKSLPLPKYATSGSACVDLYASIGSDKMESCQRVVNIYRGDYMVIKTGIAIELPYGYEAQIRPRSGLAMNEGTTIINSPGTIDCDYRGEIMVGLINHICCSLKIKHGDRIAQMCIQKVTPIQFEVVDELGETHRGAGGFGSTGK